NGNVYVVGVDAEGYNIAFLTIKYGPDGNEAWRVVDAEPNSAYADAVAVDAVGNVVVAGRIYVPLPNNTARIDYLTIKYDSSGVELWRDVVTPATSGQTRATSLALDAAGNAYLTAMSDSTGNDGYLIVSYDANGSERWRATPKASPTSQDLLYGSAV